MGGDPLPAANDNEAFRTAKTKLGTADEAVRRFVKDMSSPVSGVSILHKLRHGGASDPELGKRMRTLVAIYDMIMAGLLEGETSITEMVEATVLSEYVYGMIIDGFGGEPGWCDERLFVNWLKGVTNA